jgi:hypothetical protein
MPWNCWTNGAGDPLLWICSKARVSVVNFEISINMLPLQIRRHSIPQSGYISWTPSVYNSKLTTTSEEQSSSRSSCPPPSLSLRSLWASHVPSKLALSRPKFTPHLHGRYAYFHANLLFFCLRAQNRELLGSRVARLSSSQELGSLAPELLSKLGNNPC